MLGLNTGGRKLVVEIRKEFHCFFSLIKQQIVKGNQQTNAEEGSIYFLIVNV